VLGVVFVSAIPPCAAGASERCATARAPPSGCSHCLPSPSGTTFGGWSRH